MTSKSAQMALESKPVNSRAELWSRRAFQAEYESLRVTSGGTDSAFELALSTPEKLNMSKARLLSTLALAASGVMMIPASLMAGCGCGGSGYGNGYAAPAWGCGGTAPAVAVTPAIPVMPPVATPLSLRMPPGTLGQTFVLPSKPIPIDKHPRTAMLRVEGLHHVEHLSADGMRSHIDRDGIW